MATVRSRQGQFITPLQMPTYQIVQSVDFNGDGNHDIVVSDSATIR